MCRKGATLDPTIILLIKVVGLTWLMLTGSGLFGCTFSGAVPMMTLKLVGLPRLRISCRLGQRRESCFVSFLTFVSPGLRSVSLVVFVCVSEVVTVSFMLL